MSAIEAVGLELSYGEHAVLRSLDLVVPAGAVTAVLGPSGCGKTSLLRVVAGLLRPSAGSLRLGDRLVRDDDVWVRPKRFAIDSVVLGHSRERLRRSHRWAAAYSIRRAASSAEAVTTARTLCCTRSCAATACMRSSAARLPSARSSRRAGGQRRRQPPPPLASSTASGTRQYCRIYWYTFCNIHGRGWLGADISRAIGTLRPTTRRLRKLRRSSALDATPSCLQMVPSKVRRQALAASEGS